MGELTVYRPPAGGEVATRAVDGARLMERWLEGRSAETVAAYTGDLRHFAEWYGSRWTDEHHPSEAINGLLAMHPGDANETAHAYRAAMLAAGLAPASVNRRLAALRSLVDLAREFGMINWELSVSNVRQTKYRDTRGPTPDEVAALLKLAGSHRDPAKAARDVALVMVLFGLGLRVSEAVGIDMANVDLRGARVEILGKGRRETEWLTVPPPVMKAVKGWIAKRGREAGPLFRSFHTSAGTYTLRPDRLKRDSVEKLMEEWGEELELSVRLRPHGLRHSAITEALNLTRGDVRAAQRFSRHKSLQTLVTYDDNRTDMAGQVAGQVAGRMSGVLDGLVEEEADEG